MRRFLRILAAVIVMVAVVGVGATASAAPGPRVTARLAISSECVATVYVTWANMDPSWLDSATMDVNVTAQTDGTFGYVNGTRVTTEKGKAMLTFTGTPRADGKQDTVATVNLIGFTDTSAKTAACSWVQP